MSREYTERSNESSLEFVENRLNGAKAVLPHGGEIPDGKDPPVPGYVEAARYVYKNAAGEELFYRVKWRLVDAKAAGQAAPREKDIRTYYRAALIQGGPPIWTSAAQQLVLKPGLGGKWCLYGLEVLAAQPGKKVLLVEGEGCADAVNRHPEVFPDHIAVSATLFGVIDTQDALDAYDLSPLEGRDVTVWADFDYPGQRGAQTLCSRFRHWKLLQLAEDAPHEEGWDVSDFVKEGGTASSAATLLKQARRFTGVVYEIERKLTWTREFVEEMGDEFAAWLAEQEDQMRRAMPRNGDLDYGDHTLVLKTPHLDEMEQRITARAARDRNVYDRGGVVSSLRQDGEGKLSGQVISSAALTTVLSSSVSLYEIKRRLNRNSLELRAEITPVTDFFAKSIEGGGAVGLAPLTDIIRWPIFLVDGEDWRFVNTSGYDEASGLFFDVPAGVTLRDFSGWDDERKGAELRKLYDQIAGILCDAVGLAQDDRLAVNKARYVSAFLTLLTKKPLGMLTPGFGFTAHQHDAGKTFSAERLVRLAAGLSPNLQSFPTQEEEQEKRLGTMSLESEDAIVLDNINSGRDLRSAPLAAYMTKLTFHGRVLGSTKAFSAPATATLFFTGNNLTLSGELATRIIPIELDGGESKKLRRGVKPSTGFTDAHEGFVQKYRRTVLKMACEMLALARNMDAPFAENSRFPAWDQAVRRTVMLGAGVDPLPGITEQRGNGLVEQLWADLYDSMFDILRTKVSAGDKPFVKIGVLLRDDEASSILRSLHEALRGERLVGVDRGAETKAGMVLAAHPGLIEDRQVRKVFHRGKPHWTLVDADGKELEYPQVDSVI